MKWGLFSFIGFFFVVLLVVNIYLYIGKTGLKSNFSKDEEFEAFSSEMSKCMLEVSRLGEIQKMYVLTKNEDLKTAYAMQYRTLDEHFESYTEKKIIKEEDYKSISELLKENDKLTQLIFTSNKETLLINDVENISKGINIQNKIIDKMDVIVKNKKIELDNEKSTVLSTWENYITSINVGSGVFSSFLVGIFVFFRTHFEEWFVFLKNKVISDQENEEKAEKELMELRYYYQFIQSYHQFMGKRWEDNKEIVEEISRRIYELEIKDDVNSQQLKNEISQLRILFQELPGFHEMVVGFLRNLEEKR